MQDKYATEPRIPGLVDGRGDQSLSNQAVQVTAVISRTLTYPSSQVGAKSARMSSWKKVLYSGCMETHSVDAQCVLKSRLALSLNATLAC